MTTPIDILEALAQAALDKLVDEAAKRGKAISQDLLGRLSRGLVEMMERGPGVTDARVLVVEDERS